MVLYITFHRLIIFHVVYNLLHLLYVASYGFISQVNVGIFRMYLLLRMVCTIFLTFSPLAGVFNTYVYCSYTSSLHLFFITLCIFSICVGVWVVDIGFRLSVYALFSSFLHVSFPTNSHLTHM